MAILIFFKWVLFAFGAYLCALNFYLSFLRYPLYLRRGLPKESYKFASGIPIIGSLILFLLARYTNLPPVMFYAAIGLIIADTGGIHWAVASIAYYGLKEIKGKIWP
jgi:hypothetical protein